MQDHWPMNFLLLSAFLFSPEGFAMSPFTADSRVLSELLKSGSNLWKSLHGPIQSIQVIGRKNIAQGHDLLKVEVRTAKVDSSAGGPPSTPACIAVYEAAVEWDFTVFKKMTVKELSLKCDQS